MDLEEYEGMELLYKLKGGGDDSYKDDLLKRMHDDYNELEGKLRTNVDECGIPEEVIERLVEFRINLGYSFFDFKKVFMPVCIVYKVDFPSLYIYVSKIVDSKKKVAP